MTGPVRVAMECDIIDRKALWDVAAQRAVQDFAMTLDDVVDTIGPRDDPQVDACVYMVFDCLLRKSGAFDAFEIVTSALPQAASFPLRRSRPAQDFVNVAAAFTEPCQPHAA